MFIEIIFGISTWRAAWLGKKDNGFHFILPFRWVIYFYIVYMKINLVGFCLLSFVMKKMVLEFFLAGFYDKMMESL